MRIAPNSAGIRARILVAANMLRPGFELARREDMPEVTVSISRSAASEANRKLWSLFTLAVSIWSVYADYGTQWQEVAIPSQHWRIKTGRATTVQK